MDPSQEAEVRRQLDQANIRLAAAERALRAYLELTTAELEAGEGLGLRLIKTRIKQPHRVIAKLSHKTVGAEALYDTVGDLVGAQVIVHNLRDVELLRARLQEDDRCLIKDLSWEEVARATGYRALHCNGWIPGDPRIGCEIQIRTMLQDAWAVTARTDLYDGESHDEAIAALAKTEADHIHVADQALENIRRLTDPSQPSKAGEKESPEPLPVPSATTSTFAPAPAASLASDDEAVRAAIASLSQEDLFVLKAEISPARVQQLRDGIAAHKEQSTVRQLFIASGSYERLKEYKSDRLYGIARLFWKGPFCDGSNWVEYRPQDFSSSLGQFLFDQFCDILQSSSIVDNQPAGSWAEVLERIEQRKETIRGRGGTPDVIVIQGTPGDEFYKSIFPRLNFTEPPTVRDRAITDTDFLSYVLNGVPVLVRRHQDLAQPLTHVVDLQRYSRYVQTNPSLLSDADIHVGVEQLNLRRVLELIDKFPDLLSIKEEQKLSFAEQIVNILLHVRIEVTEAGHLDVQDQSFALGIQGPSV